MSFIIVHIDLIALIICCFISYYLCIVNLCSRVPVDRVFFSYFLVDCFSFNFFSCFKLF